jgi:hypothetical protein
MIRDAFLANCRLMHDLVGHPLVRERWDEPSALPEMTVGALAGHSARAAIRAEELLNDDPPGDGAAAISAAQYYLRLEGLSDRTSALSVGIRERADAEAAAGVDDLLWRIGECIARLQERLEQEPAERLVAAFTWAMRLDDYLRTRVVELTVHIDDLASSIGVPTPQPSPEAMDESIATLVGVALGRHGDLAVLRALTRAERDDVRALRVL